MNSSLGSLYLHSSHKLLLSLKCTAECNTASEDRMFDKCLYDSSG